MHRLTPPLLLPCQMRRLPGRPPAAVPPRNPPPFIARFVAASVNGMELPTAPFTVEVTVTFAPERDAVAIAGMSVLIAVTMLLPSVVVLEFSVTWPAAARAATNVKVCVPIVNVSPATAPPVVRLIVPLACVSPVPIGSIWPEKPSPPSPICHWTGPVGRSGKHNGARPVVLCSANRVRSRVGGKIAADVARVELDRVQSGVHIDPARPKRRLGGSVGIRGNEHAAIAAFQKQAGGAGHECKCVMVNVHHMGRNGRAAVSAGDVVKRGARACRKPGVKCIDKYPVGIIRVDRDTLVVPVLRVIAAAGSGRSCAAVPPFAHAQRSAGRAGHELQVPPPSVLTQTPSWQPLPFPQPLLLFAADRADLYINVHLDCWEQRRCPCG